MKIAVVGSRGFKNYYHLEMNLNEFKWDWEYITIVSGGAKGADELAKKYAIDNNVPFIEVPADWNSLGKAAGAIRNGRMVDMVEVVLAFWDGESKGTRDMINKTLSKNKELHVYPVDC